MILVIDNYDSFTYNLVQYLGELGADLIVRRNDRITKEEADKLPLSHLVISPGPGYPEQAGISKEMIRHFAGKMPVLGVCLGHQCIAEVYGGKIVRAGRLMHGKTSPIHHHGEGILKGVPDGFTATRYHSLIIERESLPECLKITGETREGEIMALKHRELPVYGLQFHPESILTEAGKDILRNFMDIQ